MKKIEWIMLGLVLVFVGCKKDNLEKSKDGYVKCMVNGQEWTAKNCLFTDIIGTLSITASGAHSSSVTFTMLEYSGENEFLFSQSGSNAASYIPDETSEVNFSTAYSYDHGSGSIQFSENNSKEIKGSFHFNAYTNSETDSVIVTGGEFRAVGLF